MLEMIWLVWSVLCVVGLFVATETKSIKETKYRRCLAWLGLWSVPVLFVVAILWLFVL